MPLTRTYSDVIQTDIDMVTFRRSTASSTGWFISAMAIVRAGDGVNYTASITREATASQATVIENFVSNNVVAAVNAQEGLA